MRAIDYRAALTSDNAHKFLVYAINVILALALVAYAADRVNHLFFSPAGSALEQPAYIPEIKAGTRVDYGNLLPSWHLFGVAQPTTKTSAGTKPTIAPETKLELTLRGTYVKNDKHHGLAIIQNDKTGKQQYFTIKQDIFALATLEEIYEDRVILLRNGRHETLVLPKKFLSSDDFYSSDAIKAEKKRVASNYRNTFLSRRGMDLIKLFGFRPLHKDGGFHGFTITALGEQGRQMMETLGVMEGDLITVVNGMRLSESLEALESLKDLKTATSIDAVIERDGAEIPFHFELDPPPPELAGTADASSGTGAQGTASVDDDLGEDWGQTDEDVLYMEELKASTTRPQGVHPVEFDH